MSDRPRSRRRADDEDDDRDEIDQPRRKSRSKKRSSGAGKAVFVSLLLLVAVLSVGLGVYFVIAHFAEKKDSAVEKVLGRWKYVKQENPPQHIILDFQSGGKQIQTAVSGSCGRLESW